MTTSSGASGFDARIWLLALGTFAIGTDAFVVVGILPDLAGDLRVTLAAAGLVVSIYSLTYALGSPFLAAFTARVPRHKLVGWALIGFALANLLSAAAPSYGFLIAVRIIAGIGASLYTPTAYALAAALAGPERRGRGLSAVALGLTGSMVLGIPLGTIIGHQFGWHATFVMVALLSGIAAAALRIIGVPAQTEAPLRISLGARLAPLARPRSLLALLPCLIWASSAFTAYTYIVPLLRLHLSAGLVPALLMAYGIGGLIGSQTGGRMADRYGSIPPMAIFLACAALNQALFSVSSVTVAGAAAAMFLWAFCGWMIFPPQQARLMALDPANSSVMLALNNSMIYLGSSLGAALGGLVVAHWPITRLTMLAGIGYAIALAVFGLSVLVERNRARAG